MKNDLPLVSILMLTYNHAPYIEQAMESCLSQETSFPFELVVCDDASTDGTSEIVRQWADRHQNLVYLPQPVNGRAANNMLDGMRYIRSKYIAFCEGDDYWKSPHKLEKQVQFLKNNPDFSVCCHRVEMQFDNRPVDEKKQYIYKDLSSDDERIRQGIFYADEVIASYYFQTSSFVFRWRFQDGLPPWFRKWMLYDHALMMLHAVEGKIKYFDEAMSVWRRNETGYSWLQNVDKGVFFQKEGYGWVQFYEEMDRFFAGRFHLQIRERILLGLRGMIANCLETGNIKAARKILTDHEQWCLKMVADNAGLFKAAELALPEKVERVPPWSTPRINVNETETSPATLGGFMELGVMSIPEAPDSVWTHWTEGQETACFANPLAALVAWIYHRRVRRIWLPVIFPRRMVEELQKLWIPYQFYPVGGDFSPPLEFIEQTQVGDAVLTLSWLGRPPRPEMRQALIARKDVLWIDDRSQALATGTPCEADVTLYAPADVLGVPDGGILIGAGVRALHPASAHNTLAARRGELLLERFEHPALDSTLPAREEGVRLATPIPGGGMSRLSTSMLRRIPLPETAARCRANWSLLNDLLGEWALWPQCRSVEFAPIFFPLRLPQAIPPVFVLTALNRQGILCSGFELALPLKYEGSLGSETELLRCLLCLPCDHRYDETDMRRMTKEVLRILRGESDFGTSGSRFTP